MECIKCGMEIVYSYTYERGRHKRDVFFCENCNIRTEKKVDTLPNNIYGQKRIKSKGRTRKRKKSKRRRG